MKRILTGILVLLMLISSVLVSCQTEETLGNKETDAKTDGTGTGAETEEDLLGFLPDKTFDGAKYTIFDYNPDTTTPQVVELDEESKEVVVTEAIYRRNVEIEGRYDVTIVEFSVASNWDDRWSKLHETIFGGEDIYDLAVCRAIRGGLSLVYDNIVMDFNALPYVDVENPWWNQTGNTNLVFNGKQYFANAPIDLHLYMMPFALYTNLDIVKDVNLDSPVQAVLDYTWTADLMLQYCKAAHKDMNGDSVMDGEDRYGLSGVDYNTFPQLMAGFDVTTVVDDDDGYPILNQTNAMITAYETAYDLFYGTNASYYNNNPTWGQVRDQMEHFGAGLAMFTMGNMSIGTWSKIRPMEMDLTVLPVPMLDENQGDYYTYTECPFILAIPSTASVHSERTGLITEALAAVSYTTVLPAYYETALKEKYTRDEEGIMKQMIDMIYKNLVIDKGIAIWDEPREVFLQALYSRNDQIVSILDTKAKLINRTLTSDMDKIAES